MSPYDAVFRVIIFGDKGSGKTTLLRRLKSNLFISDSRMTIGVDFDVKEMKIGNQKVKLQIWDFGNEDRYKFLLPSHAAGAKGGLFIYDITNYFSLTHIDDWLSILRKERRGEDLFPILVVGAKADLADDREISEEEGRKIAKLKGMDGFIECSSKTGVNVEKAFKALTWLMMLSKPIKT